MQRSVTLHGANVSSEFRFVPPGGTPRQRRYDNESADDAVRIRDALPVEPAGVQLSSLHEDAGRWVPREPGTGTVLTKCHTHVSFFLFLQTRLFALIGSLINYT